MMLPVEAGLVSRPELWLRARTLPEDLGKNLCFPYPELRYFEQSSCSFPHFMEFQRGLPSALDGASVESVAAWRANIVARLEVAVAAAGAKKRAETLVIEPQSIPGISLEKIEAEWSRLLARAGSPRRERRARERAGRKLSLVYSAKG